MALEGAPEGYMISTASENVPLALDFLKFATTPENGKLLSAPPYGALGRCGRRRPGHDEPFGRGRLQDTPSFLLDPVAGYGDYPKSHGLAEWLAGAFSGTMTARVGGARRGRRQ
jgi:hypothetical protein